MNTKSSSHSVHSLNYHLILVTKYRREVITQEICQRLKDIFTYIGEKHGIEIIEFNHDEDHVHVLFTTTPTTRIVAFINSFKTASSRLIKKEYPQVTLKLWKEAFWSRSYYLSTVGEGATLDILTKYVQSQGENET